MAPTPLVKAPGADWRLASKLGLPTATAVGKVEQKVVGLEVGEVDGDGDGAVVGAPVVGAAVVGLGVGESVGLPVGAGLGEPVGDSVGAEVGPGVGAPVVGLVVGCVVGTGVGEGVGTPVGEFVARPNTPGQAMGADCRTMLSKFVCESVPASTTISLLPAGTEAGEVKSVSMINVEPRGPVCTGAWKTSASTPAVKVRLLSESMYTATVYDVSAGKLGREMTKPCRR